MDDEALLRLELRATREELVRRGAEDDNEARIGEPTRSPLMPDRDEAHLRLAVLGVEDLESHVDRLERDLRDLREGLEDLDSANEHE